jgi:hypothetical protein
MAFDFDFTFFGICAVTRVLFRRVNISVGDFMKPAWLKNLVKGIEEKCKRHVENNDCVVCGSIVITHY